MLNHYQQLFMTRTPILLTCNMTHVDQLSKIRRMGREVIVEPRVVLGVVCEHPLDILERRVRIRGSRNVFEQPDMLTGG